MRKRGPDTKNQILDLLKKKEGLTITEVANKLDLHHITASKYLAVLEAEKRIIHRGIGMAKVFKPA
jgi:predicted ArsR family transcriptional regulator